MPDLPNRTDYFNIGADDAFARSAVRSPEQRLSPEEIFTEGSDVNIMVAGASAMAEEVTRQLAIRTRNLYLEGAVGEDLDRLVGDRFSPTVVRKGATPAVAQVEFSRSAGPLAAVTIEEGTVLRTPDGIEFEVTATTGIPAASTGPITSTVEARETGISGNVAAGTITTFKGGPPDPNIVVTNPEPAAGGDETETDERLRSRAKEFFRTARRGTLEAIEFGALTVEGVRQATAVEDVNAMGQPTGRVQLFIADALGQANASLVTAVRNALLEYRAAGVVVDVFASAPVFVDIVYSLQFQSGVDTTLAFQAVQELTVSRVNQLRPNQTLQVSLLYEVARLIPGVIVPDDAVVEPVGDVVPVAGQVLRTSIDRITSLL